MKIRTTYFYVYVYLLIKKKVRRTWAYQTWVPYYKELKLGKLKYHRREKKRAFKIEYYVAWNSSLAISSSMWHFFNKKIHVNTRIFFMKLECLKLDLYSKLEFQKKKKKTCADMDFFFWKNATWNTILEFHATQYSSLPSLSSL